MGYEDACFKKASCFLRETTCNNPTDPNWISQSWLGFWIYGLIGKVLFLKASDKYSFTTISFICNTWLFFLFISNHAGMKILTDPGRYRIQQMSRSTNGRTVLVKPGQFVTVNFQGSHKKAWKWSFLSSFFFSHRNWNEKTKQNLISVNIVESMQLYSLSAHMLIHSDNNFCHYSFTLYVLLKHYIF